MTKMNRDNILYKDLFGSLIGIPGQLKINQLSKAIDFQSTETF